MTTLIDKQAVQDYVGFEPAPTEWLSISQERINQFADCTMDQQFIHVDPVRAKETPFGTTIVHGFLSLSLLSYLSIEETKPGSFRVNTQVTLEIEGEEKPALIAEWISIQMVA